MNDALEKQIQFSTSIQLLFDNWQRLRRRAQSRSGLVVHQRSHKRPHLLVIVCAASLATTAMSSAVIGILTTRRTCVINIELMEVDALTHSANHDLSHQGFFTGSDLQGPLDNLLATLDNKADVAEVGGLFCGV